MVKNKNHKNYNSNKNNNNYIAANQMGLSVKMYHYILFAVSSLFQPSCKKPENLVTKLDSSLT